MPNRSGQRWKRGADRETATNATRWRWSSRPTARRWAALDRRGRGSARRRRTRPRVGLGPAPKADAALTALTAFNDRGAVLDTEARAPGSFEEAEDRVRETARTRCAAGSDRAERESATALTLAEARATAIADEQRTRSGAGRKPRTASGGRITGREASPTATSSPELLEAEKIGSGRMLTVEERLVRSRRNGPAGVGRREHAPGPRFRA